MTLNEAILSIVNENSGGVKFTKLVTALVRMKVENGISDVHDDHVGFVYLVEKSCREMSEVEILEYAMLLGNGIERLKMFVYIPLS